jgi:hypothetical protein
LSTDRGLILDHDPKEYWKQFGRLITAADKGAVITCIGWIFFWMDHIPEHIFHTHFLVNIVFIVSLGIGIHGTYLMLTNRGRFGTRADRIYLKLQLSYAIFGSIMGLIVGRIFPPT